MKTQRHAGTTPGETVLEMLQLLVQTYAPGSEKEQLARHDATQHAQSSRVCCSEQSIMEKSLRERRKVQSLAG